MSGARGAMTEEPEGLVYRPDTVDPEQEAMLVGVLEELDFRHVTMRGETARRTVRLYGIRLAAIAQPPELRRQRIARLKVAGLEVAGAALFDHLPQPPRALTRPRGRARNRRRVMVPPYPRSSGASGIW